MSLYKKLWNRTVHLRALHTYGILEFVVPLPLPYYREIWNYKTADTESIQKTISSFEWHKRGRNKNANEYF